MFRLFIFSLSISFFVGADDSAEIIEVLAPKSALHLATDPLSSNELETHHNFDLSRTIADKLNTIAGVSLNGQGGQFQSYSIRGFSRNRIRTEIDGIPIITDRRAGNAVSFISANLISHGHVIKGPSSTLYGSQALGGVVNLSTDSLEPTEGTMLKASAQANNQALSLTAKQVTKTFSTGVAYQRSENDIAADGSELNTQFERVSGLLKYRANIENRGLTTVFSWLPSYGQDIGKSNTKYPHLEISYYPQEIHSLAQVQVNSEAGWLAKLFHHFQDWSSETRRINNDQILTASLTEYKSNTIGGQWLSKYKFAGVQSFLGIDWLSRKGVKIASQYDVWTSDTEPNDFISNDLNAEEDNLAVFNKNQWPLGKAKAEIGLRYDWLTQQSQGAADTQDSKFSASASIRYPVSQTLEISLNIANGFRYPTLSERFFSGNTPRAFVQGNQGLQPETSQGTQLIANWQSSANSTIKTAFYHYDMDNYIERYYIDDELLSYQNINRAHIAGFEIELTWFVDDGIEHKFTYQHQDGEDENHNTLNDLIPQQLSWALFYEQERWQLTYSVRFLFENNQVGNSEATRKQALIWDLSVDYQLNAEQSIQLIFNNVSNESYYASFDEDATMQPEQSFKLAFSWLY